MSVDIFSLRALENISKALESWSKLLSRGIEDNEEPDDLPIQRYDWRLRFAGYVSQQYIAKRDAEGQARPVGAYEKISKRIPDLIQEHFVGAGTSPLQKTDYSLGSIPTLHSIIPMAQNARSPVFAIGAKDGVVGSHFLEVRDLKDTFENIAQKLEHNIDVLSCFQ